MKKIKFISILFIFILSSFLHSEIFHKVKLLKISDGDTFIVYDYMYNQKLKLRLLYIDTPEKFSSRKLTKQAKECRVSKKQIRKLGRLASHYAKDYFRGQKHILVLYKGKGHYKRMLAVVKRLDKNTTYNYDVVNDGYACIYKYAPRPKIFDSAFYDAKKQHKGLWGINYNLMNCLCK